MNKSSYQLSSMQQGMLFHHLKSDQLGVDIEQMLCSLPEALNVSAFKQAWQRVVGRHSILRTSFCWQGLDEPVQTVHSQVQLPLEQQDWRHLSVSDRQEKLQAYLQADRQQSFDLTKAPLMRLALFQLGEADYKLVWTFHHILLDSGSLPLVLKEVFGFYQAFCQGEDLQLAQPHPYQDYIEWLQQDLSKAEVFWQAALKGFTAPTPLVVDRLAGERQSEQSGYGEQHSQLSEAVTKALKSLAQEHELTLETLVQGAWALLLSRYSGEEDVIFGAVRGCRASTLEGAESMVGLLINTLPVRVGLSPDMSLLPWLQNLQSQWISSQDYEYSPLVKVQAWSEIPGGTSLFESLLIFENDQLNAALQSQGGSWSNREFQLLEQISYPITLFAAGGTELLLKIAYDRGRFEQATITRMLGHLQTMLAAMVTNPQQCLAKIPMLTPAERHQLLVEWNDTQIEYPKYACIHQLFEEQVERSPDAVAVVFENQQLTYRQLNCRANQIAHYLQSLGVEPDVLVAISVERSLEMLMGLLGILKAGGGYVPLDPAYPQERLGFMLSDSQVPVVLTQKALVGGLPDHEAHVVCLDTDWAVISQQSEHNPVSNLTGDNLAYVIYTSGSTGKPKGVQLCHRSVTNFLNSMGQQPGLTEQDILLAVTTISFDIAVLELYLPLITGAKVVLVSREMASNGAQLLERLKSSGATIMQATPATWRMLLSAGWERSGPRVKILCGGEALPRELATQLLERSTSVWNVYGPTETTVWSTAYKVEASRLVARSQDAPESIGRPIANTQIYLLDAHLQPVPIGVAGELHIGGAGLARGYLNRPELTQEKFIPNPFSDEPGERLYKTGDIARYLPDGNIDYIGRIDHQVKIRGFRIELGEIEAVLTQHIAVQQVVIVAREDVPGDKRLVAYLVPVQDQVPSTSSLRSYLKEHLPDYMVPAASVSLDSLPLTPNGKIDRRALPAPEWAEPERLEKFVAPRTPVEEALAAIWSQVLSLEQVSVHDNFFELGGHSLLATQLISRLHQAFEVEISLQSLFESPTLTDLAECIETIRWATQDLQATLSLTVDDLEEIEL